MNTNFVSLLITVGSTPTIAPLGLQWLGLS